MVFPLTPRLRFLEKFKDSGAKNPVPISLGGPLTLRKCGDSGAKNPEPISLVGPLSLDSRDAHSLGLDGGGDPSSINYTYIDNRNIQCRFS
mmetsp:Transcript_28714/g.27507  ORF Transcript_28714/g.27507 Transcript_28714/m.27507 type:complete len:91 (-) Transcript_28714:742-1014(-)